MRVLIAPDKFKGSLTAAEVADRLAKGLAEAGAHSRTLPLADGGDGSVAAALASGFHPLPVDVHGATGENHRGVIAFDGDTTIVEVANTCGLATLPGRVRAPMSASSYGFGEAIRAALTLSRHRLVLALGGSANTDGGVGMLAALGYRFLDRAGDLLAPRAENLELIHCVDPHHAVDLNGIEITVAGDVTSPLLGPTGAAAVFGPQKGATATQVAQLNAGLENLVATLGRSGVNNAATFARACGSGAAGGIGFAAMLLGATTTSGAEYFLDLLNFDQLVADADLVITGEGRLDDQTLNGKLPAAVALRAAPAPVIAVVGRNDLDDTVNTDFADVFAIADFADGDTSRDPLRTAELLQHIGTQIGSRWVHQFRKPPHNENTQSGAATALRNLQRSGLFDPAPR
jgi:glycerate 2-kinase